MTNNKIVTDFEKKLAKAESVLVRYVKKHPIYAAIISAGLIAASESIQSILDE
ncbi:hypothetical protein KW787_01805 [Candidatus Pacearchaeota archaeon]|nr:hypothetical protein [Candidatus Pacearchaeota archaeon]